MIMKSLFGYRKPDLIFTDFGPTSNLYPFSVIREKSIFLVQRPEEFKIVVSLADVD